MKQPPGFVHPEKLHYVCRLKKAIYGLNQAPRTWFHCFSSSLLSHSFVYSTTDPSMFVYRTGSHTLILLLYVNDIILTGSSTSVLHSFVTISSRQFAMKDMADLHYFLGLQVVRTPSGIFLTQHKYVLNLLRKFQLQIVKPVRTPSATRTTLSLHNGDLLVDPSQHRSMVGVLQYLTITQPDITHSGHAVSQFICSPHHLSACHKAYVQALVGYYGSWTPSSPFY